jgi:run domain Beclin-1 interacting cysteine-rich containing protein
VTSCKYSDALLELFGARQHFLAFSDGYSLQDFADCATGTMHTFLKSVRDKLVVHITQTCPVCRGKGYYCELCRKEDLLFPFMPETEAVMCAGCKTMVHASCSAKLDGGISTITCPKCIRIRRHTTSKLSPPSTFH